jgi:hypothetical protein
MTAQTEIGTLAVKVGEISGQLRELIHQQNNMAMKLDGLTERMLTSPTRADFEKLEQRVEALEAERHRSDGVRGFVLGVMRSPVAAWAVAAGAALFAAFKGDVIR